jgi:hypothetical protein
MSEMHMSYAELVELAREALKRANMANEPGHPEDLAAALAPAIDAVALGFGEGYRRGFKEGKTWSGRSRNFD